MTYPPANSPGVENDIIGFARGWKFYRLKKVTFRYIPLSLPIRSLMAYLTPIYTFPYNTDLTLTSLTEEAFHNNVSGKRAHDSMRSFDITWKPIMPQRHVAEAQITNPPRTVDQLTIALNSDQAISADTFDRWYSVNSAMNNPHGHDWIGMGLTNPLFVYIADQDIQAQPVFGFNFRIIITVEVKDHDITNRPGV